MFKYAWINLILTRCISQRISFDFFIDKFYSFFNHAKLGIQWFDNFSNWFFFHTSINKFPVYLSFEYKIIAQTNFYCNTISMNLTIWITECVILRLYIGSQNWWRIAKSRGKIHLPLSQSLIASSSIFTSTLNFLLARRAKHPHLSLSETGIDNVKRTIWKELI